MKLLKCGRCKGPFSEGMNVEELDGKKYHAYCAGAEREQRRGQEPPMIVSWFALLFFPWLPIR